MKVRLSDSKNHSIELLPRRDRQRLLALCEPAPLVLSKVLYQPGQPMRHVCFPTDGFVRGHHGTIRVESSAHAGTVFTVKLPKRGAAV